jgi:hypothetical protein
VLKLRKTLATTRPATYSYVNKFAVQEAPMIDPDEVTTADDDRDEGDTEKDLLPA